MVDRGFGVVTTTDPEAQSQARAAFTRTSRSLDDTAALATLVAQTLVPGDVVLLVGELGAGKTAFAKFVGQALGCTSPLTSPTFTIMTQHRARLNGSPGMLLHLDAYRLEGADAIEEIGVLELLDEGAVAVIEWGDIVAAAFGDDPLRIEIAAVGDDERMFTVSAHREGPWVGRVEVMAQGDTT